MHIPPLLTISRLYITSEDALYVKPKCKVSDRSRGTGASSHGVSQYSVHHVESKCIFVLFFCLLVKDCISTLDFSFKGFFQNKL